MYPVIINQYFLKYRATASGLSHSGACVGTFLLPFVIEYMLRNFGLPGTFLITGGLILNVLPAALLMIEPSWIKNNIVIKQKSACQKDNEKQKSSSPMQSFEEKKEVVEEPIANAKKLSSSGVVSGEKKADDNVLAVTRSATVLNTKGLDNPSFVTSKADVRQSDHELIEVSMLISYK